MGMIFRQKPNTTGTARRGVAVGVGTVAVGAVLLGGATAGGSSITSAQGPHEIGPSLISSTEPTVVAVDDIARAVPSRDEALVGFAPPSTGEPGKPKGDRDPQFRVAADLPSGPLGIPGIVLKAYKLAATRVAAESPQCKLPWFLLAGIGRIESGHAGNGNVDEFGDSITTIRGPVLDGSLSGNEVITDTDGGRLDGDRTHDRAMGPMQFIPSTWSAWGSDANGDGEADPDNIFDATYSAGRYLCAGVTDIMSADNKVAAVMRYNRSLAYAENVLAWAAAYAAGVMPTTPIPEMRTPPKDKGEDTPDKKKPGAKSTRPAKPSPSKPEAKPGPSESTKPSAPSKPKPKPPQNCIGPICLPPPPPPLFPPPGK